MRWNSRFDGGARALAGFVILLYGCDAVPVPTPSPSPSSGLQMREVTRPRLEDGSRGESMTAAQVTRPAVRIDARDGPYLFPLGVVEPGSVEFAVSTEAPEPVGIFARLVGADGEQLVGADCVHTIGGGDVPGEWRGCRVSTDRRLENASLEVRVEPVASAPVLLASPLLVPKEVSKAPPPIFVIVLDTARFDVFEMCSPGWLEALARDGIVFDHARTSSPWTRPAIASLFTGLPPWHHQVLRRLDVLNAELETLAESAASAGYVTRAFATNPNVLPVWGFDQGFDVFEDIEAAGGQEKKPDAEEVLARVRSAFPAARERPEFFYIQLMDPHAPLRPTRADRDAFSECGWPAFGLGASVEPAARKGRRLWPRYLAEVRGMGRSLEGLFESMKEAGLYARALILVVSDHGEEFSDHGKMGHGKQMYEETLRVPAVLKLPNNQLAGTRVVEPVRLEDLHRIVLEEAGLRPKSHDDSDGFGLDPEAPQIALLRIDRHHQSSITKEGWKLIVNHRAGRQMLFDLESDPLEQRNRIEDEPARAASLRSQLDGRVAHSVRGLHLRFCGTPNDVEAEFELRTAGHVTTFGFENVDSVREGVRGSHTVRIRLEAGDAQEIDRIARAAFPTGRNPGRRDEDEILIAEKSPNVAPAAELSFDGHSSWDVAFGVSRHRTPLGNLDLSTLPPEAIVGPGVEVQCGGVRDRPLLRVWYTRAGEDVGSPDVDDGTRERLRALGYAF